MKKYGKHRALSRNVWNSFAEIAWLFCGSYRARLRRLHDCFGNGCKRFLARLAWCVKMYTHVYISTGLFRGKCRARVVIIDMKYLLDLIGMYECVYTYIKVYRHIYKYVCIYIYVYVYVCMCIEIRLYIYAHEYIHTYINTCIRKCM